MSKKPINKSSKAVGAFRYRKHEFQFPDDSNLSRLEAVMLLADKYQFDEFEWELEGEKISLRRNQPVSVTPPDVDWTPDRSLERQPQVIQKEPETKTVLPEHSGKEVTSPFVGMFYRAASPTAEPYVQIGSIVKPGDTLCIIEAMKLMNEIEAERGGKVVSILVENGQPVEFGEPLFVIESN
jgi:acetyl-CoA carboxylase biotin carboxyl carrier protein